MTAVEQPTYNDPTAIKSDALNAQKSVAFDNRYGDDTGQLAADALRQKSALAQKDEAATGELIYGRAKAEQKYLKGAESAIDSPRPPLPTYEKIKNEPNPEDYHKYSVEFASASALLGAIAGKWTRAGGTASLNAFAGAMQGWQKGNLQAYEEASKQWEQASKKTIDNNNIELAKYKAILEDRKMNIDEKLQGLTIAGYEAQNSVIVGMGKDGNFNGIAQAVDKMAMANQRYGAAVDQLSGVRKDQTADQVAQIEYLNSNPEFARQLQQRDPGKWAQIGAAGELYRHPLNNPPQGSGEQLQGAVDMVGQNRASLATVMSRMPAADKATFTRMLSQQYPEYRQQEFNAENAGATSYQRAAGSQSARIESASNEVEQLLPQAIEASRALPRGKFVPWNKLSQQWEAGTSDPAYNDFAITANFGLTSAYVRAMNPTGNPRIADRFEVKANNILSLATDQKSYEVQAARLWKEVQASKIAVAKTSQGRTGGDINAPMPGSGAQDSGVIRYDAQGNRVQ